MSYNRPTTAAAGHRSRSHARFPVVHSVRKSNTTAIGLVLAGALLWGLACRPAAPDGAGPLTGPASDKTVSITLAWDPPQTDVLGGPLEDLASYRVYFGSRSPLDMARDTFVEVGLVTTYTLYGLEPGTYFFAMTALDDSGNESPLSGEVGAELSLP